MVSTLEKYRVLCNHRAGHPGEIPREADFCVQGKQWNSTTQCSKETEEEYVRAQALEGPLCVCGGEKNFSVAVFEFEVDQG